MNLIESLKCLNRPQKSNDTKTNGNSHCVHPICTFVWMKMKMNEFERKTPSRRLQFSLSLKKNTKSNHTTSRQRSQRSVIAHVLVAAGKYIQQQLLHHSTPCGGVNARDSTRNERWSGVGWLCDGGCDRGWSDGEAVCIADRGGVEEMVIVAVEVAIIDNSNHHTTAITSRSQVNKSNETLSTLLFVYPTHCILFKLVYIPIQCEMK